MTIYNTRSFLLSSIFALASVVFAIQPVNAQGYSYSTSNGNGVANGPRVQASFTLRSPTMITQIMTYHWNSGRGSAPGSIGISTTKYQMLANSRASGSSGQGGVPNVNWTASFNTILQPGTYFVIDSDLYTWSYNSSSYNAGFISVSGNLVSTPPPPTQPTPTPVAYKGNCRGAGCVHPDLRAYGGSGLCNANGCGVERSVHVSLPNARILELGPSTSVASLAQQCSQVYHGSLRLVDDERYYYYYIGLYAKFACQ